MLVSIISVNRNNCIGLRQTIVSVLNQKIDRALFEYIVIDGASSDGSVDCIKEFDSFIDKWISEPDSGIYQAMNKGIGLACGRYCLFLNSGDYLHDEYALDRIVPYLDGMDLVVGKMEFLNNHALMGMMPELSLLEMLGGSLPHNATFISRTILEKHPYDEKYKIASDWKLWVQSLILDGASYCSVDSIVSCFDCNGISSRNRKLSQIERDQIIRELIPSRVLSDYSHFLNGRGYGQTEYDRFYIQMRDSRYGKVLFMLNKIIMRFAAVFFRSARFVNYL